MKTSGLISGIVCRHSKGDTIVEVMIAIAVMSSVLAGAFAVTQKSSKAVRDSQEHSEVLQILQGQVELVRAAALLAPDMSAPIYDGSYFCMQQTDGAVIDFPTTVNIASPNTYPVACKELGPGGLYATALNYDAVTDAFKITGRWTGLNGVTNFMTLSYRISPGNATVNGP